MISIILADNHELIREGIASLLSKVPDFNVISQCSNGRQLIKRVKRLCPNVAVLDVSMPELNGVDAAKYIRRVCPSTRIIALSDQSDEFYIREMINAGVSGYVVKSGAVRELIEAIRNGSRSKVYLCEKAIETLQGYNGSRYLRNVSLTRHLLTQREREILQLIGEGDTSKEIATKLNISETTVKTHRNHLMDKLNVRDIAGLTRQSIRLRLVHVE